VKTHPPSPFPDRRVTNRKVPSELKHHTHHPHLPSLPSLRPPLTSDSLVTNQPPVPPRCEPFKGEEYTPFQKASNPPSAGGIPPWEAPLEGFPWSGRSFYPVSRHVRDWITPSKATFLPPLLLETPGIVASRSPLIPHFRDEAVILAPPVISYPIAPRSAVSFFKFFSSLFFRKEQTQGTAFILFTPENFTSQSFGTVPQAARST